MPRQDTYEGLAKQAAQFDNDTRDLLRKHEAERANLVERRKAEKADLMARKLAAYVAKSEPMVVQSQPQPAALPEQQLPSPVLDERPARTQRK